MKIKKPAKKKPSPLIKAISKLSVGPKEMLVINTVAPLSSQEQQNLTNELGQQLGYRIAVLFTSAGTEIKVISRATK